MLNLLISFTMIFLSLIMFFINHPLMMGLLILSQTMMLSLLMGMYINTYWISYILFLIFLGGLLVLFIYVSSIAYNEMIKFLTKFKFNLILLTMMMMMMMIFIIIKYKNIIFIDYYNNEMNNFNQYFLFFNESKINLSKFYDKQTFMLITMIIIYLFITLIAVIKITNFFLALYDPLTNDK